MSVMNICCLRMQSRLRSAALLALACFAVSLHLVSADADTESAEATSTVLLRRSHPLSMALSMPAHASQRPSRPIRPPIPAATTTHPISQPSVSHTCFACRLVRYIVDFLLERSFPDTSSGRWRSASECCKTRSCGCGTFAQNSRCAQPDMSASNAMASTIPLYGSTQLASKA